MKHQVLGLFAQPLSRVDIDTTGVVEFFEEKIKPTIKPMINEGNGNHHGLKHYHCNSPKEGWPGSVTNVFNAYPELKWLEDSIVKAANFAYQNICNYSEELHITDAWFNECDIGSGQFWHNHCNSVFSGTLYLRTDEHTEIEFQSPFGTSDYANTLLNTPNLNKENEFGYNFHFEYCGVPVSDGACLFWPSYIKHGYQNNQTPNRLSLSFNLMPNNFNCLYNLYHP